MRVFIAGMEHETNSFSPIPTSMESFSDCLLVRPSEMSTESFEAAVAGYPGVADFLRVARTKGHEAFPSLVTFAKPSAPASSQVFESLRDEILSDLRKAGKVDFVLLYLHGAQVATGYPDCEGALLGAIRAIVGGAVPIGVLMDLHGNVSPEMVRHATILMGCLEYPHTDFRERAQLLFEEIERIAHGAPTPKCAFVQIPMLGLYYTTQSPMREVVRKARELEQTQVRCCSLMHGFPWSDTRDTGASVLVYADTAKKADENAKSLANEFFALRGEAQKSLLPLKEAVAQAIVAENRPVIIADGADNVGAGAASDSTFALHALRDAGARDVAVGIVWDPASVALATSAGVGARLTLQIGGKMGTRSGPAFNAEVQVTGVAADIDQDAYFERAGWGAGAAAVQADGITILLSARRRQFVDPRALRQFGVDTSSLKLIVVKSMQHFRERFEPVSAAILYADTPGSASMQFEQFSFLNLRRPMWPLDPGVTL